MSPPTLLPRSSPRTVAASAFDLAAAANVETVPDAEPGTWRTTAPHAELITDGPYPAGWYRLHLKLRMTNRFTIRKKGQLFAEFAFGSSSARLAAFGWNRGLAEEVFFELPHPTVRLRLSLSHIDGPFVVERFDLEPVGAVRTFARALRTKLHLLAAYKNFWYVTWKGCKTLARGQFTEVRRKVLKSLSDAHTLRLETREASEVDAALWRRQTISSEKTAEIRETVAGLENPPPIAVLIPVDTSKLEQSRMAIYSVLRQLYPHWQLAVACPIDPVPEALTAAARGDSRVTFVLPTEGERLGDTVRRAVKELPCEHVVVLKPDWELREHALFHFANLLQGAAGPRVVTCDAPEPPKPHDDDGDDGRPTRRRRWASMWSSNTEPEAERLERLRRQPRFGVLPTAWLVESEALAEEPSAEDVGRWFESLFPPVEDASVPYLNEMLATPLDGGSLLERGCLKPRTPAGPPLFLSGDLVQISGYDHLVFAMLKGLLSLGVHVHRHPMANFRNDLVPPALRPPTAPRAPHHPQIAVTAPFIVHRYKPDRMTAIYTMWETEWLDRDSIKSLNRAGLVIVPATWVRDVFQKNSVTTPIEVVPLGIDPLTFHSGPDFPTECVFGTAGALDHGGLRKNVQRVIELFRRAFPTEADVKLRVKITPTSPMVNTYGDSRIDVLSSLLPHGELGAWYRSLTSYVNASHAEGFGLHLLEAMACGRPLISTAYSGPTDYFDATVGYVVGHTIVDCRNEIYRGRWADPNDDDIIARMQQVHTNRSEARTLGERSADRARLFTWRESGRRLVDVLQRYDFIRNGTS